MKKLLDHLTKDQKVGKKYNRGSKQRRKCKKNGERELNKKKKGKE